MAEKKAEEEVVRFEIPHSLRNVLDKLPSAEAIRIIDDIGKVAWVVDNNNNNNAKGSLEQRFLEKLTVLDPVRLKEILETKG